MNRIRKVLLVMLMLAINMVAAYSFEIIMGKDKYNHIFLLMREDSGWYHVNVEYKDKGRPDIVIAFGSDFNRAMLTYNRYLNVHDPEHMINEEFTFSNVDKYSNGSKHYMTYR